MSFVSSVVCFSLSGPSGSSGDYIQTVFVPLVLSVDNKNLDVGILGHGIEAGATLLPFGWCVLAPDAAMAHYLCVGEFLAEEDEQIAQ